MAKTHERRDHRARKVRGHTQANGRKRVKSKEQPDQVPLPVGASANLPEFHEFRNVREMRAGLKLLDLTFPHSKQDIKTGKWHSLPSEDLETIYSGRKRHMEAHTKTVEWHANRTQVLMQRINIPSGIVHGLTYGRDRIYKYVTYVRTYPIVVHRQTSIRTYVRTYVNTYVCSALQFSYRVGGVGCVDMGDGVDCVGILRHVCERKG